MIDYAAHFRYERRVRKVLDDLAEQLSINEKAEVEHLIEHSEIVEAVRTLAWIIADEKKLISRNIHAEIMALAEGTVPAEQMPLGFSDCIRPD
jgi:hypothetical protein